MTAVLKPSVSPGREVAGAWLSGFFHKLLNIETVFVAVRNVSF